MENTVKIPGIGEVVKSNYIVTLDLDDTFLLVRIGNPVSPKIWVTKDEWAGKAPKVSEPPEEIPKEEMPKFESFKDALEAFDKKKQEKLEKNELEEFKSAPEGSLYPLEELEKLRLDELLIIITMAYGEKAVREKIYAVDGHCPKGKKCSGSSCSHGEKDADS